MNKVSENRWKQTIDWIKLVEWVASNFDLSRLSLSVNTRGYHGYQETTFGDFGEDDDDDDYDDDFDVDDPERRGLDYIHTQIKMPLHFLRGLCSFSVKLYDDHLLGCSRCPGYYCSCARAAELESIVNGS